MNELTIKAKKLVRSMLNTYTDAGTIENTLNQPIPHWEGKYWDDTPVDPFENPVEELGEGKYFYTVPGNEDRLVLYYQDGKVFNIGTDSPVAKIILLLQEQDYETINETIVSLSNETLFPTNVTITFGRDSQGNPTLVTHTGNEVLIGVIEDFEAGDGGAVFIVDFGEQRQKIRITRV